MHNKKQNNNLCCSKIEAQTLLYIEKVKFEIIMETREFTSEAAFASKLK